MTLFTFLLYVIQIKHKAKDEIIHYICIKNTFSFKPQACVKNEWDFYFCNHLFWFAFESCSKKVNEWISAETSSRYKTLEFKAKDSKPQLHKNPKPTVIGRFARQTVSFCLSGRYLVRITCNVLMSMYTRLISHDFAQKHIHLSHTFVQVPTLNRISMLGL